ncbi:AI-2E family transporter [Jannaschia rubra]|uniref:AI-2E family transporter n=1 Tax=Jannaschia rubra TaxID=282197 RepID=UPI00249167C7|nr:AI-2E family transporter [Jannaschia rubra]
MMRPVPDRATHGPLGVALIVLVAAVLLVLAWMLSYVLLVAFMGILIAVLLRHSACAIARHTPLSARMSVGLIVVAAVAVGTAFVMTFGPRITSEMEQIGQILPEAARTVADALQDRSWGKYLLNNIPGGDAGPDLNLFGAIGGTLSTVISVATNVLVLIAVAIFLALDPQLYRRGVLHLMPLSQRDRAEEILDALGYNLWLWLQGQLLDMAVVAVLTGAGLWLIGVPLSITLGLIAGITNFIPYVGPFISGIPAVLIAFANEPSDALWAAGVFLLVQQFEGNVLMPVIQKRVASLPPALSVLAIVAFGVLFGFIGLLVATPLLLVVIILIKMIYVEDILGDHSVAPPESAEDGR